ncbi:MAG: AMP-binding protein [Rickettsiales bacterium]|nr:AMP-binding protein [Pseudomonadota bacterium]MDA0967167.1 AMP-binding protein [Pseudomonadota bacterium]MDG4544352.1 AMP-binding protein [Rickettsiales bacterium]MDG4546482.1 AMP-binding protein [Rickettsiales bacterium]MDG4548628.1 AMP-binding protein [Rickettsiales bacterium]
MRTIMRKLFKFFYNVEVKGIENFKQAGDRVLIVANHLSFIDAALIYCFMPQRPLFAVNSFIARKWYFRPFLKLVENFPLDPTNPMATKAMINEIKKDKKCMIFPEGRITVTGSLMKVYEGPGMIADKSDAKILPVRIDGAQYTPFSRLKGKVRIKLFPKITITILEPRTFDIDPEIKGRKRRHAAGIKLYDLMSQMLFDSSDYKKTLFRSVLDQSHIHGRRHIIAEDALRKPINYGSLITRCFILGDKIAQNTKKGEYVGVMLPNMVTSIVTFFALQYIGRVPAMLNFSTGEKNLISACKTAKIKSIYTSKRFVTMGKLEGIIEAAKKQKIKVIYLEDVAGAVNIFDKLTGFCKGLLPSVFYKPEKNACQKPAVVLFTSGSEGTPKGVVLSHENIQANRYQLASRVDFGPTDIVFNALPIFHSFGLTGGTLLPVLSGIRTFFYPSPLHYRIVPELIYDTNATIMFGTDTFLSGYARFANSYDFYSVRYVFAGAERLKEETRRLWAEKYGVRIFEGYGATETSPALSTNTPMHNKPGTVGRLLPAIEYKLEDVPGIEDGGKLIVKGANIMKGYLLSKTPGKLIPPENGYYDTGDIVSIDDEGYITIKGRAKRFAKIAGEMVSLTAVETYLSKLWADNHHAVVSIPDAKKGEALVLVTDKTDAERADISAYAKKQGIGELSVPKTIKIVDKVPLLGTGKTDYVSVQKLAS